MVVINVFFGLVDLFFCLEYLIWGNMYDLLGEVGVFMGVGIVNKDLDVDVVGDMLIFCESDFIIMVFNSIEDEECFICLGYGKVVIDMVVLGEGFYMVVLFN